MFSRDVAVEMANISLEFLARCEAERLIVVRDNQGTEPTYSLQDISQMALIYRLHDTLGIHVTDMEVVLHLRQQVLEMRQQVDELEKLWIEREEQLLSELSDLRIRLAEEADWK